MLSSDLKYYKPKANGRMGGTVISSGVTQNVFPHVSSAQRTAGLTDYYKIFCKAHSADNDTLIDPLILLDKPTAGGDHVTIFPSGQRTATDQVTLAAQAASASHYGAALVQAPITAGDQLIDVTLENAAIAPGGARPIFRNGGKIRLMTHSTATANDGAQEDLTISGTPTQVSGLVYRIATVEQIAGSYAANGTTRVVSLIEAADLQATATSPVKTSTSGTVDGVTYPIQPDNQGTVDEDWTITFTSATAFTCVGDTLGTVGSGTISGNFAPNNPDFTRPYFTIATGFWGGTWATNDTVTFTTHPSAYALGEMRVIPAGTTSLTGNVATVAFFGEAGD
jgi:hypothetical protein